MTQDELLSPSAVCAAYPLFGTPEALAERRHRGGGPDYIKTAKSHAGRVFYRRSAIERWLEECTVTTSRGAA